MADEQSCTTHETDDDSSLPLNATFPKPPTPPPDIQEMPEAAITSVTTVADPPPPYPSRERRFTRAERARLRRAAQISAESGTAGGVLSSSSSASQPLGLIMDPLSYTQSEPSPFSGDGDTETTPLLSPRRRPRTLSHSTVVSTHSIAQTVLSLFGSDDVDAEGVTRRNPEASSPTTMSSVPSSRKGVKRYFRPLWRGAYYRPLVHLLFVNFFYALLAFVYLFVGTLTGTTLLIALPLGAVICWLNLAGARIFARGEIAIQTFFHGPLSIQYPTPPYPIFSRTIATSSILEAGQQAPTPPNQPSFLRNTYAMFTDQTSYQAIFYFLVIKPSITLFLTIAFIVLVPVAFVLIVPAPAVLRAIKRIGIWQANIALEGLLHPRL